MSWKERIIWIIGAVLLVVAIVFLINRKNQSEKGFINYENSKDEPIRRTKDESGSHGEKDFAPIPAKLFDKSKDSTIAALRDKVKRSENLLQYTRAQLSKRDTVKMWYRDSTIANADTSQPGELVHPFEYADDYMSMQGLIRPEDSSIDLSYTHKYDIAVTHYKKRDKWYKKKHWVVDVTTSDPHSEIDTLSTIVIEQPKTGFIQSDAMSALGWLGAIAAVVFLLK